jgi:hypothetical protein
MSLRCATTAEFLSRQWFDLVNRALADQQREYRQEPLLQMMDDVCDVQSALELGLREDPRDLTWNIAMTAEGSDTEPIHVCFNHGRFQVGQGWLRHCDAVVQMDKAIAREAFRSGTDAFLANAVVEGTVRAAGSWDAVNFLRVHLIPDSAHELMSITV